MRIRFWFGNMRISLELEPSSVFKIVFFFCFIVNQLHEKFGYSNFIEGDGIMEMLNT